MTQANTSGWTPEEIRVLDHAQVWQNSAVIKPHRFGRTHTQTAERLLAEEIAAAGLTPADFEAWCSGRARPGRSSDLELPSGQQMVMLPAGYDDVRDRGKLVTKLCERIPGDPQVETITRDAGTVTAVVCKERRAGGRWPRPGRSHQTCATPTPPGWTATSARADTRCWRGTIQAGACSSEPSLP